MDITDKINKINQSKKEFNNLLTGTNNKLEYNSNKIDSLVEAHSDLLVFVQKMNIFEKYRWNTIKTEYITLKKKINKDRKLIHSVTKFFGTLTNYYDSNEIEKIDSSITSISNMIDMINYKFNKLKEVHRDFQIKKKHIIKNDSISKISDFNDDNKKLLQKIYENYIGVKMIDEQLKSLNYQKKKITSEITTIKNQKIVKH